MIDERAVIHAEAKIAEGVSVGPWTVIGARVEIGSGSKIGPHVVINGPCKIGQNNQIFQFSSIGEAPQSLKYAGEPTLLTIGDNNVIREFCTLHRGTASGGGLTSIGDRNFMMAYVHIAHDCHVGNEVLLSNNAALSGHVTVDDYAAFGGFSAVHQFCRIGSYCFVAGETSVPKDVLPYTLVSGHPAAVFGLNIVGLKRRGFGSEQIAILRKAYNTIYRQGLTTQKALLELEKLEPDYPEIARLVQALKASSRGIVR